MTVPVMASSVVLDCTGLDQTACLLGRGERNKGIQTQKKGKGTVVKVKGVGRRKRERNANGMDK
jgi:hypothetical protein